MKSITKLVMFLMMITMPVMANDIYVTQSGATLTFDVLQDGQNNTIGNSNTASTVTVLHLTLTLTKLVIRMY